MSANGTPTTNKKRKENQNLPTPMPFKRTAAAAAISIAESSNVLMRFSLRLSVLSVTRHRHPRKDQPTVHFVQMGQTLSAPIIEKHSSAGHDDRFAYGASGMQGWRISILFFFLSLSSYVALAPFDVCDTEMKRTIGTSWACLVCMIPFIQPSRSLCCRSSLTLPNLPLCLYFLVFLE